MALIENDIAETPVSTPPAPRESATGTVARMMRRGGAGAGALPYDFRRPTKLSRDHTRALQMGYETFAKRLGTQLTSGLRQVCQINLVAIEQQAYEDYISGLSETTMMASLTIDPLPGTAIFEFAVPTALACLDYLLGGPGGEQPTRPLTDLETPLLRGLLAQMLDVLRYAMESTTGIQPALTAIEYNPQFVQASSASDVMVVGSFEMHIGNQTCLATLCIPFSAILPKLDAGKEKRPSTPAEQQTSERNAANLRTALGGTPVPVTVRFAPTTLTPAQIVNLAPGDVLPLNHRVTAPLAVEAGGTTFAYALAGRRGTRLAGLVVGYPREKSA